MKKNFYYYAPDLCNPDMPKIRSKTEALTYAISITRTADGLHLDKADDVFRMFVDNIELPDVAEETTTETVQETETTVETEIEKQQE